MRTRKKPWTQRELATNDHIVHEPALYKGRWREYFGNDGPVHLELGCGKGRFLARMASVNPEINFVGLERDPNILAAAGRNVADAGNAALILGDAKSLAELFGEGEADKIYIQFCDPWPNKKKWAKRRLTNARFLEIYRRVLRDGGEVLFKTDNRQLFEFSITQFSAAGWLITAVSLDARGANAAGGNAFPPTEYEEKFMALDMPIYQLEARPLERKAEKDKEQTDAEHIPPREEQASGHEVAGRGHREQSEPDNGEEGQEGRGEGQRRG